MVFFNSQQFLAQNHNYFNTSSDSEEGKIRNSYQTKNTFKAFFKYHIIGEKYYFTHIFVLYFAYITNKNMNSINLRAFESTFT